MIFMDGIDDFVLLELKAWHKVETRCGWEPHTDVGIQKASPPCELGEAPIPPPLSPTYLLKAVSSCGQPLLD